MRSFVVFSVLVGYFDSNHFEHPLQVFETFAVFFYVKIVMFDQQVIQVGVDNNLRFGILI